MSEHVKGEEGHEFIKLLLLISLVNLRLQHDMQASFLHE